MAAVPPSPVSLAPIATDIVAVSVPEVDVRALLISGRHVSVLLDTLLRPSNLETVREMVESRGRPLVVVNSHADWDHWWGNAAFPDAPVIAHRATKARQRREGARQLAVKRRSDRTFGDVVLRPATVVFDGSLELDLGGLHVELWPLPGHTHDQIVAYVPEHRLLFAADAAEDPIPLVTEGPITPWSQALREWSGRARTVVPSHGGISGPQLLERNAAYLEALCTDPTLAVPELEGASVFYQRAHRRNLKQAAADAVPP